jgi:hypothetical protein
MQDSSSSSVSLEKSDPSDPVSVSPRPCGGLKLFTPEGLALPAVPLTPRDGMLQGVCKFNSRTTETVAFDSSHYSLSCFKSEKLNDSLAGERLLRSSCSVTLVEANSRRFYS